MQKILIIRRDNIGDLVLTTPLLLALRKAMPTAWISVLTNDYAAPVLDGISEINAVFTYRKLKHTQQRGWSKYRENIKALWSRLCMLHQLRQEKLDWILLATPDWQPRTWKLAKALHPKKIAGFHSSQTPNNIRFDFSVNADQLNELPESARCLLLLQAFDILAKGAELEQHYPLRVIASPEKRRNLVQQHISLQKQTAQCIIALHISARKPSQRWPIENWQQLALALHQKFSAHLVLLWAPGQANNPTHPGDDEKAAALQKLLINTGGNQFPLTLLPTHHLHELAAALSLCDFMICADGGAMHIAAGLGKPIICLFGKSDATRWRPWGVTYRLLQHPTQEVINISPDEVMTKVSTLNRTNQKQN